MNNLFLILSLVLLKASNRLTLSSLKFLDPLTINEHTEHKFLFLTCKVRLLFKSFKPKKN